MARVDRLLSLANGAALHKALRDAGYPAKYRTVARWVQLRQAPAEMEPAILEAFGLTETETPPPWWAEASAALVDQMMERMMATGGLADLDELAGRVAQQLADELRQSPLPDDEGSAADNGAPRDAGHTASKRQT